MYSIRQEQIREYIEDKNVVTIKELQAMAQRFRVAAQLRENKNYNEIQADTGASSATISRVKRALEYGDDGYQTVIPRLREKTKNGEL